MTETPELLLTEVVDDNYLLYMARLSKKPYSIIVLEETMCVVYDNNPSLQGSNYFLHMLVRLNENIYNEKERVAYTTLASKLIASGFLRQHLEDIGIKCVLTNNEQLEFLFQYSSCYIIDLEDIFRMADRMEEYIYILKQMAVEDKWEQMEYINL